MKLIAGSSSVRQFRDERPPLFRKRSNDSPAGIFRSGNVMTHPCLRRVLCGCPKDPGPRSDSGRHPADNDISAQNATAQMPAAIGAGCPRQGGHQSLQSDHLCSKNPHGLPDIRTPSALSATCSNFKCLCEFHHPILVAGGSQESRIQAAPPGCLSRTTSASTHHPRIT